MKIAKVLFNPRYSVSDTGIVFGVHGRPLKTSRSRCSAHKLVDLVRPGEKYNKGKNRKYVRVHAVHRLVAEAFLGQRPFNKAEIRHLNDVCTDNRVENLAWGTRSENIKDRKRNGILYDQSGAGNGNSRLSEGDVIDIRIVRKLGAKQIDIANCYGITQTQVSTICLGKQWRNVPQGL